MKTKRTLFLVGAFVLSLTSAGLAEVQNVKVGGELRTRAYFTSHLQGLGTSNVALPVTGTGVFFFPGSVAAAAATGSRVTGINTTTVKPSNDNFGFIQERVQVYVESDLTDNVFARVTMEAKDVWGHYQVANTNTSFTSQNGANIIEDGSFDISIAEAYAQLSELYYSPLSVKVGRQYMNFGRGFMVSDNEKEQRFDAVRTTLDFYPFTVDAWYAKVSETLAFDKDRDFWGVNMKYSADTWNVELYTMGLNDKQTTDVSPVAIGLRGDITPIEPLDVWAELVYEGGTLLGNDLNAYAAQVGGVWKFKKLTWTPEVKMEYTFGSGSGNYHHNFVQFFEYNYYGYVLKPVVSNIHILNAGFACYPVESLRGFFDFYYYHQATQLAQVVGDPFQDNGGVSALTNGKSRDLGTEVDFGFDYQYTEDVTTQLVAGWFMPGNAYDTVTPENTAFEIRGELLLSF